jgi:hypothetical protein
MAVVITLAYYDTGIVTALKSYTKEYWAIGVICSSVLRFPNELGYSDGALAFSITTLSIMTLNITKNTAR